MYVETDYGQVLRSLLRTLQENDPSVQQISRKLEGIS